ncbi:hypothetical protein KJ885_00355 [Patescibacteria group bacterium]|nr:hypothetical protein [Patescibacteria group bacterium]
MTFNDNEELLKKANIEEIAKKGAKIYEKVKSEYEDKKGEFLAIEVESGDVYLSDTSVKAIDKARKVHPDKVFYIVKIGYSVAETLASMEE